MSPWVRYDDTYHDDPRVMAVSLAAVGLLHVALVWASRHLTDGWVSQVLVRQRADRAWKTLATELASAELWTEAERTGQPGYQIAADLVALQPTRTDVERNREAARVRQQRVRSRDVTPASRPMSQRDDAVTHAPVTPGVTAVSHDPVPTRPDPEDKETDHASGLATRLLAAFPKRSSPDAVIRWFKATQPSDAVVTEIMSAVDRYSRHVSGWKLQYIKNPARWLNDGDWKTPQQEAGAVFTGSARTSSVPTAEETKAHQRMLRERAAS